MERTFCHPRCACFSSPESHVWHTRDGRTEDQVAYLEKLFGLQADDALTSVDASGTNLSLDANELSKADTPTKEPAYCGSFQAHQRRGVAGPGRVGVGRFVTAAPHEWHMFASGKVGLCCAYGSKAEFVAMAEEWSAKSAT